MAMLVFLTAIACGCVYHTAVQEVPGSPKTTTSTSVMETTTTAEGYVYFHFVENNTNCSISGNVTLNNLSFAVASSGTARVNETQFFSRSRGLDLACVYGTIINCPGDYNKWRVGECWEINISRSYFYQRTGDVISFRTSVNTHRPKNYEELSNFVRPMDVKGFVEHQISIGFFTGDARQDIEKIWSYVDSHVSYRYDSDTSGMEYWKLPNQTLTQGWGDCEDWSNLFVSLARAYNESIECYSMMLPSHLGSFCKLYSGSSEIYGFYDQRTMVKGFGSHGSDENAILETLNSYFSEYQLDEKDRKVMYVFNDEHYHIFKDNREFAEWASELG